MIILIPALIESDESERLLHATLAKMGSVEGAIVALISQGRQPEVEPFAGVRELRRRSFPQRIGKWRALRVGLEMVSDLKDEPLLVLDADDPVSARSLAEILDRFGRGDIDYMIGERAAINLTANDQHSEYTRTYVEIFSNTLLLRKLSAEHSLPIRPVDIQSGLQILGARARQHVNLSYVVDYGGELALFHELAEQGITPTSVPIHTNPSVSSNYRIQDILASIARLPFFRGVSPSDLGCALDSAPIIYSRYIPEDQIEPFDREMRPLVEAAFGVAPAKTGMAPRPKPPV